MNEADVSHCWKAASPYIYACNISLLLLAHIMDVFETGVYIQNITIYEEWGTLPLNKPIDNFIRWASTMLHQSKIDPLWTRKLTEFSYASVSFAAWWWTWWVDCNRLGSPSSNISNNKQLLATEIFDTVHSWLNWGWLVAFGSSDIQSYHLNMGSCITNK